MDGRSTGIRALFVLSPFRAFVIVFRWRSHVDPSIKALLLDIGGVLLTRGWGTDSRRRAADYFGIDYDDLAERHSAIFHTYEEGRITLDQYLQRIVFYCEREFTVDQFKEFIYAQSQPYPAMLGFVSELKFRYKLRTVALSNEGREIMDRRIREFNLTSLIDFFVCSCYVGTLKPDPAIFHFAMDQVQLDRGHMVFIDDSPLNVEVARELDIQSIHHASYDSTRSELAKMGLALGAAARPSM